MMNKIFLLHRHGYWTEYFDFLLEDQAAFGIVASEFANNKTYGGSELEVFDQKKHKNILTPGIIDDKTNKNFINFRTQHSPGFYIISYLIGYEGFCQFHKDSDIRISMLYTHYRALLTREINHPGIDAIRYKLMTDPRVNQVKVDLSMHQFINVPKQRDRVMGTGLICMSWLFMFVSMPVIVDIFKILSQEVKLTIVIHPCTSSQKFIEDIKAMEGGLVDKVFVSLPRDEMIELYDAHEFIITDGSGSCYEAMFRGCKPLAVRGLYKDHPNEMAMQLRYDELEEEYFPFQSFEEISRYREKNWLPFLQNHFPYLYEYTYDEAKDIARKEILSVFNPN